MSLRRFFIEEFVEVIEWRETDRDTILWKFPDRDANIKYGANLTVRESQTAVFLNEGEFADVFEPGRYELLTENMPLLTSLKNWDKGFKSPFLCDVYFASTKTFTDLKWANSKTDNNARLTHYIEELLLLCKGKVFSKVLIRRCNVRAVATSL